MMALASVAVDHELLTRGRDHQPLRRSGSGESVRLIQCREYNRKVVDRTIEGVPPATFPLVFLKLCLCMKTKEKWMKGSQNPERGQEGGCGERWQAWEDGRTRDEGRARNSMSIECIADVRVMREVRDARQRG